MKLFEKLRAVFNFKGQKAEMQLESAEIRGNKVFLHPADDPDHTFCVSGKAIDILIAPEVALTEDDFFVIENQKLSKLQEQMEIDPTSPIEKLLQSKITQTEKQPPNPKEASKQSSESKQTLEPKTQAVGEKEVSRESQIKAGNVYQPPKMRTVSMRLYPEEYDFLMAAIEENGYKKTEYLLACVAAAKKKSMMTNYQKYYEERMRRRREQREAARRAMEEQESLKEQVGA